MSDRIAYNRREAAEALGVSEALIKREQAAGRLKAKATSLNKDGERAGASLFTYAELLRWFDSLPDG